VLASRQVELDVQAPDRSTTLRLSPASSEKALTGVGGQTVTAAYDPREQNLVYALTSDGRSVISYKVTADYKKQVASADSGGKWMGWVAVLLGLVAFAVGRKR
jgi:MYXO-CTERM domain-containing protein